MVNGDKMSKSAGNFYTLRDLLNKGFSGRAIRWVLLSCHYRKKLNFTFDAVAQAEDTLKRFGEFFRRMRELPETAGGNDAVVDELLAKCDEEFYQAIGDDLNVSAALAVLFNLQREANKLADNDELSRSQGEKVLALFRKFDRIFDALEVDAEHEDAIPAEVAALAEARVQARKDKNWAESDRLRDEIKSLGYMVEDAPGGKYRIKAL